MKIKPGASLQGLNIIMRPVLVHADRIWKKYGQELVVTCGTDGEHSAGSLHYYGFALDLRTNYFTQDEKAIVESELANALAQYGNRFQVIPHPTHIHVEHDIAYW